ncbi:MAG: hypothetical protein GX936_03825 [Clostridiales bacterium]|jgi:hypothetical protein|nr:hypothetical protein [Clostridiales bacterium]
MANRKRRFGDRKDGRLLRSLDPFNKFAPFIMKHKNEANNSFADSIEITELDRFLRKKRAEGFPGIGMLHVFLASYCRVVSQLPALNRFVAGQRIYARNNIEAVLVVKKTMSSQSGETSIKVKLEPSDTISDVYYKINAEVEKIKSGQDSGTDETAKVLMKIPRVILKFCVFILNILEYFGKLPQFLIDVSPFHGSLFVTDLGSIGIPPVYHHLYNFGNIPLFLAFGAKRRALEVQLDGSVVEKKYVDYTLVLDERIGDGFFFAQVFKYLKSFIRHPQQLDVPPETIVEDVD